MYETSLSEVSLRFLAKYLTSLAWFSILQLTILLAKLKPNFLT
jgi:hypothetical protein